MRGLSQPSRYAAFPTTAARHAASGLSDLRVSLKGRLNAWWHGNDYRNVSPPKAGAEPEPSPEEADASGVVWSPHRIRIVQEVFGEGFIEPGGAQFARKLLSAADPSPTKTVLDLTAGLGGTAFTLAREHELWMEAYEPDAALAEKARELARTYMLSRRVPVHRVDFTSMSLTSAKYDLIYSRDRLFTILNKPRIIRQAGAALKPGGQLLIVDYVVKTGGTDSPEYANWLEREPEQVFPWTEAQYLEEFKRAKLKLRASQDFSAQALEQIASCWQRALRTLQTGEANRAHAAALAGECEIWLARSRALESGTLNLIRLLVAPD